MAERCCLNAVCACGKDTGEKYLTRCRECRDKFEAAKEAERFEKAVKLTEWDGWVFCEGCGYQDGFFPSLSDFDDWLEDIEEEGLAPIKYVWACKPIHFVHASLDNVVDSVIDQAYEDFDTDDLSGLDELKAAIQKFNEANKDCVSYEPDYSKVILLEKVVDVGDERCIVQSK